MDEDFYQRMLNDLLRFQDRQFSNLVDDLVQQVNQEQTVSEVVSHVSANEPRKAELRTFLYLIRLAGIVKVVQRVNGVTQAQADDLLSYLYEISGVDTPPSAS